MLISETMNESINAQIGRELGASNQYLNIAAYFEGESLPELSAFFFRQSEEEREHALKFVRFLLDAGAKVEVPMVEAARHQFDSAETAVRLSRDWELEVTKQINTLMDLAIQENDHTSQQFLRWFVDEQLEEVATMEELLGVVRRAGEEGLLFVEQYVSRKGDPHAAEGAA